MHKAVNNFAVKMDGDMVKAVGKSIIYQSKTSYSGKKTKWYEDKRRKQN